MNNLRLFFIVIIFSFAIFLGACKANNNGDENNKPIITVSLIPQEWFVTRIAGDKVNISTLLSTGQNPHNYELSPRQIAELASSKAWILSGTEFEISLEPKIRNMYPKLSIVNGVQGVKFRTLENHSDDDDDGEYDRHHISNIDRHMWLGLAPAKIMATHIKNTLINIDSANTQFYQENYEKLIDEIEKDFTILKEELAPLKGKTVFVYHPSFGYFLDEFGIIQSAIETGGKEPGPQTLASIIDHAKEENAVAIFVQAQFPIESARTIAQAINAEVVLLDPLSRNWLENIHIMGNALKKALTED